jgi:hypothetical protein
VNASGSQAVCAHERKQPIIEHQCPGALVKEMQAEKARRQSELVRREFAQRLPPEQVQRLGPVPRQIFLRWLANVAHGLGQI